MLIESFVTALISTLLSPWGLSLAALGALLGIVLGALPGVSSTMALAILLPLSFSMEAHLAILFLLCVFVASVYGGSISAILINIPGTPGAIVTQLDGHPMAKAGRAREALVYALVASTIGGAFGLGLLVIIAPLLASVAMSFRSPEFAAVAIFGLVLLAYASPGTTVRGLLVGAIGLLCGMVGFDTLTDVPRFTFDTRILQGGVELVPLCVGLFGLAEVLKHLNASHQAAPTVNMKATQRTQIKVRSLLKRWKSMLRGSLIGAFCWRYSCRGVGHRGGDCLRPGNALFQTP
ncbi:hypothetical protein HORIV_65140 [Vreelandella olivaria]|uniref:DUF112 domain-containing protein n=1 Tax=Vreelandella olivaria TaxID=390919 RepID=A0ABN5X5H9_9GAMM|nr:hypothetical protein HORIV_65140 [Halomonas olivaria]